MYAQTILVRILNTNLTTDDALVRIIPIHLEACGLEVEQHEVKRGTRRDKGSYLVLDLEIVGIDEPTVSEHVGGLASYIRVLGRRRGLEGMRVELETMEGNAGSKPLSPRGESS